MYIRSTEMLHSQWCAAPSLRTYIVPPYSCRILPIVLRCEWCGFIVESLLFVEFFIYVVIFSLWLLLLYRFTSLPFHSKSSSFKKTLAMCLPVDHFCVCLDALMCLWIHTWTNSHWTPSTTQWNRTSTKQYITYIIVLSESIRPAP